MSFLLLFQIFFLFFAPPLSIQGKLLFPSDVMHLVVTAFLWVWVIKFPQIFKRKISSLLVMTLVLILAYIQGFSRPDIRPYLHILDHPLDAGKKRLIAETWAGIRFFSWISSCLILPAWFNSLSKETQTRFLTRTGYALAVSGVGCFFFMVGERWIPGFSEGLTSVYIRNPALIPWWGLRTYGPFGSPLEAGLALGLSFLLIYSNPRLPLSVKAIGMTASILALLLTQTLTVIAAVCFTFGIRFVTQPKFRTNALVGGVLSALFLGGGMWIWMPIWVLEKWGDLCYRLIPWKGYLAALLSFPQHFMFGFGFIPYYVDNSYLFILTRIGLFGTLGFLWVLKKELKVSQTHYNQVVYLFLLICGCFLDAWIVRPVVYLWICCALPLFCFNSRILTDRN